MAVSQALEGKKVVVVGGTIGIGRAISIACLEQGAQILVGSRQQSAAGELEQSLANQLRMRFDWHNLDVSNQASVQNFGNYAYKNFRPIDALVFSAGVYGPIGNTLDLDVSEIQNTFAVNFFGFISVLKTFNELLNPARRGKIIALAGGGAASPFPLYSSYATSKAALVRLCENLAIELRTRNVDINCIAPGFVATRLHEQTLSAGPQVAGADFYAKTKSEMDKGGVPPEVCASLVTMLISAEGDGISGKFLAAPWDKWQDAEFRARLREEKDFATLRRVDGWSVVSKPA